MQSLPNHGANPQLLAQALNVGARKITHDYSVNVNPYPPLALLQEEWQRSVDHMFHYPHPTAEPLRAAIASQEGLSLDQVIAGNGAAELIYLLAHVFQKSEVLIIEPAFSEYREACEANGCRVTSYITTEADDWQLSLEHWKEAVRGKKLCFLCRPNNPTGTLLAEETLAEMIAICEQEHVYLVIDEAFIHFTEQPCSAASYVRAHDHVILLRSLTKMYQLPGLRLGYALASQAVIAAMMALQPPWSVNGPVQHIGERVLKEGTPYAQETARNMAEERQRFFPMLEALGYVVSPSLVNFYVLRTKETTDLLPLVKFLLSEGVAVRHTYNFHGLAGAYIRLALRTPEENDILLALLARGKACLR
ncbi:L-threonine-O-3-phosphate decarboxylase [Fictibacillus macauensis ZFHKF-1]|uniref:threonine-phosphate decarboxylase n=1 Tax=Fictibacillus macauensis ZFHKF-1 TaxID=1196324 RepID=I8J5I0_9BACL|nr:threonine-phosphate decarboxylase CobD [Fictibacillus macauensis]EIT87051.1 L-threonine-O-3-phosphate decarboxylase [Fictibacillus macauensis ZFHKF-1]